MRHLPHWASVVRAQLELCIVSQLCRLVKLTMLHYTTPAVLCTMALQGSSPCFGGVEFSSSALSLQSQSFSSPSSCILFLYSYSCLYINLINLSPTSACPPPTASSPHFLPFPPQFFSVTQPLFFFSHTHSLHCCYIISQFIQNEGNPRLCFLRWSRHQYHLYVHCHRPWGQLGQSLTNV